MVAGEIPRYIHQSSDIYPFVITDESVLNESIVPLYPFDVRSWGIPLSCGKQGFSCGSDSLFVLF